MSVRVIKLAEVAEINPRRPPLDIADDELVTFVPMESVDDVTGTVTTPFERKFTQVKKGYTVFAENDVIFAKITPCMQNGKHAIVRNLLNGVGFGSTEFHVIRVGESIIPEWIHFFLRQQKTLDAAVQTFTGTVGQQRVPSTFLEELEIPLPKIDDQRRIAARLKAQLAAAEKARQAAQTRVNELEALKTIALSDVFSRAQELCRIGDVAKVQSGYAFKSQDFRTSGIRLLRNTNILPGRIYWDETVFFAEAEASKLLSYVMNDGDVVISLDRPIISSGIKVARVAAHDLPALLVQRVGRFLLDANRLDADYLYAFSQTTRFIEAISGHDQSLGVPHISPGQVEAIEIPLPSIAEQRRLAFIANEILKTTEQAQVAASNMLSDISVLPARLLAQAFEGH